MPPHRRRSHPSPRTPGVRPRLTRTRVLLGAACLGLVGGWVGLALGGTAHHEVGPLTTSMRVHVTFDGGTTVDIPPLGELTLRTHSGPLGLHATLEGVDVEEARHLVQNPGLLDSIGRRAQQDLWWGLQMALLRALVITVLGAALLTVAVTRGLRTTVVGASTAAATVLASYAVAWGTWNPAAVSEPRYTGLLTSAPAVVGDVEEIVSDYSLYGDQLAGIVQNVTGLYAATSRLPILPVEQDQVRLLHVSDLHLAPHAWDVIRAVAKQYQVDVVVDSGDITDHGTRAENRYLRPIRQLGVPYVWVRGNHDSVRTEAAMRRIPNAVVLDGKVREVAGLRFLGTGDPTFTPDKSIKVLENAVDSTAAMLAGTAADDGDVDVVVYHDPGPAEAFDGTTSMVLSGHRHYRDVTRTDAGTTVMVQGSTGGSGLRALEPEEPAKIMLSVLYIDPVDGALLAYDDISLGGLGLASAQIKRHVVEAPEPTTEMVAPEPRGGS